MKGSFRGIKPKYIKMLKTQHWHQNQFFMFKIDKVEDQTRTLSLQDDKMNKDDPQAMYVYSGTSIFNPANQMKLFL